MPAKIGMVELEIQTPCVIIDLDSFEDNIEVMRVKLISQNRLLLSAIAS